MAEMNLHPQTLKESDDEDYEYEQSYCERGPEQIYGKILKLSNMVSSTYVGQFFIDKLDKCLNIIETTGKWSLPQGRKDTPPLERPLPWIPFLMLIVTLRSVRIALSICSLMIGNSPVSASDMVYFIQIRRRKLRSYRYQGMRVLKNHQNPEPQGGLLSKLALRLRSLLCQPGNYIETNYVKIGNENKIPEEKEMLHKQQSSSSDEDVDETVKRILKVYSNVMSRENEKSESNPNKSFLNEENGSPPLEESQAVEENKEIPENQEVKVQESPKENDKPKENGPDVSSTNHQNEQIIAEKGNEPSRESPQIVAAQKDPVYDESENGSRAEIKGFHCNCSQIKVVSISTSTSTGDLSSASSSEDLFLSPIGTPTEFDFDDYFQRNKPQPRDQDTPKLSNGIGNSLEIKNKKTNVQNGGIHLNNNQKKSKRTTKFANGIKG